MSCCSCAAVGSSGCGSFVTRSLARALRRMLALGELIFVFCKRRCCARFCSVQRCSRGAQVYGTLPDAAFCNASQPTKQYTSRQDVMRHTAHAFGSVSFFSESRYTGISVPLYCQGSLATKERSLRTGEAACVSPRAGRRVCTLRRSVGRIVGTATQDDLSGHAGTPVAAAGTSASASSKQVLIAVWAARSGH